VTAIVTGVALTPGVSRNGRLYTRETVAKAYSRLAARLADPTASPVVMRTHHAPAYGLDVAAHVAAQVVDVGLNESGAITYRAVTADTGAGRDVAALATEAENGKPTLAHVSIFGWWVGDVRQVQHDGELVETADDLEIDAIDFTHSPGLPSATARTETNLEGRHLVSESTTSTVTTTAKPGAWLPKKTAATESLRPGGISEDWMFDVEIPDGYLYIAAQNGPVYITISADLDPSSLEAVGAAAMKAITDALAAMDPDMDGDIDVPGAPAEDTDGDSHESSNRKEPAVSEATSTAAETTAATTETTPARNLTDADVTALAEALAGAINPPAADTGAGSDSTATAETTTPTQITAEALAAQVKAELRDELVKEGVLKRKGTAAVEADETRDPQEAWERRGDDIAEAFGARQA